MKKRFTDDEIDRANTISILEYATNHGLEPKRVGTNSYKIEGHGGLHINPALNKWNCFSQRVGGGPIQFLMHLENKTWVESIKQLLGITNTSYKENTEFKEVISKEKGDLILPYKNNTYKHMIAYLIKTRGIDKDIVYNCIHNKTLYEDKKRNCVFVGYDKEEVVRYAGLRGTNTNKIFKGEAENSNKAFSFNIPGKTNRLYIFESPIELMSYLTLYKELANENEFDHHTLSLGGLAPVALEQYLKDNPNINGIVICLNNDEKGIDAAKNISQEYQNKYRVIIELPKLKDFNEDLISFRNYRNTSIEMEVAEEEYEMEM